MAALRRRLPAGGVGAEPLACLAEAVFAYIDELAADSVEGFAQAQAEVEDLRRRRRRELIALLLADPPADAEDVTAAARAASWEVPTGLAALACSEDALTRVTRRLPQEALATVVDGEGCLLLPDPEGPGRAEALVRAAAEGTIALGPTVTPTAAAESWRLALALSRAAASGVISTVVGKGGRPEDPLRVDDHLAALLLFESRDLAGRIATRRLAAFAELTPRARERMRETALALLRHDGNAVAMAAAMHVHPQTARYRIARLRELLGDQLDDPDARFELQLALRADALSTPGEFAETRGMRGKVELAGAARPRRRAPQASSTAPRAVRLTAVWLTKVWIRPEWRRRATRTPHSRILSA